LRFHFVNSFISCALTNLIGGAEMVTSLAARIVSWFF
jgi:hypothetical protein